MELRGKIAMEADALIVQKLGDAFEWDSWHVERENCAGAIADAILAIPEIAEALGRSYKGIVIVEDASLKPGEMKFVQPPNA